MIGRTLGHYRVLEKIGEGGMGEVYRAHDTKLGRDVAIKVLPTQVARDEERLQRFEREAHVLASLNHPNIATLYGLEDDGGTPFLVMELVEGETLAERIARGPLSLEEALPLFQQIARGLEAAHEKGIVHRDLKPANTKISPSGDIKVLDFGLAKVFGAELAGQPRSESPTITREATAAGVIMGTAAYMSPEQARGKSLDKRTDIWAFGCCLYEALSGRPAFLGETVSDTLAKILQTEPDWKALPSATPERVRELMARCLVKDSDNRLRDIGDARIDIARELSEPTSAPPVESAHPSRRSRAAVAIAVASIAIAVWSLTRSPEPDARRLVRSTLPLPDQPLYLNVAIPSVAISPDGQHAAYIVVAPQSRQLFVRALAELESTLVDEGALNMPFFSPDSRWISYENNRRMMRAPVSGGAPTLVSEIPGSLYGADWSGEQIVYSVDVGSGLLRIGADGGETTPLTALDDTRGDKTHRLPEALPGGAGVLFTLGTSTTESYDDASIAVRLRTGEIKIVLEGGMQPRYSSTGHLVYARDGALLAVPFDLDRLEVTGQPVALVSGVITSSIGGAAHFDLSEDGTLVYAPGMGRTQDRRIVWVDRSGQTETLIDTPRAFNSPKLSTDGRHLLSQVHGGNEMIWLYDIERATLTRLTSEWDNAVPIWAPSGQRFAFASARAGAFDLYKQGIDGSGEPELLVASPHTKIPTSWSPDGAYIVFHELTGETGADLWTVDLEGELQPKPFLQTRSNELEGAFSPNGKWIAYESDESGQKEIYVRSFPSARDKQQVSAEGGTDALWRRDGEELFYRNNSQIVAVAVDMGDDLVLGRPRVLFEREFTHLTGFNSFDVTPNGQRFVDLDTSVTELPPSHLVLVQNFDEELKRLVPIQ